MSSAVPIVLFVGPSIPLEQARAILPQAEFRSPVRRGDLDELASGVVGLIDGVFDLSLSVAPAEIREAIARGVTMLGSSSMGALRAAEVSGMIGVGRIYQMYRDAVIDRDDEVAILFDADSHKALTEPLVNIRYAADRLCRSGTIDEEIRRRIVETAQRLHYRDRTYRNVLREAGLAARRDSEQLIELLRSIDLKREDAHLLLERIAELAQNGAAAAPTAVDAPHQHDHEEEPEGDAEPAESSADSPVLIWEFGDQLEFADLLLFLKATGRFAAAARGAIERFLLQGNELDAPRPEAQPIRPDALVERMQAAWRAAGGEDVRRALGALGITAEHLVTGLEMEEVAAAATSGQARESSAELHNAIRFELWTTDLGLKREALRLGSLKILAALDRRTRKRLTRHDIASARQALSRLNGVLDWAEARAIVLGLGVEPGELDAFVDELAHARRASAPLVRALDGRAVHGERPRPRRAGRAGVVLRSSPLAPGSRRFCMPMKAAERFADRLAEKVHITRVGMIGELDDLGVHIAQAFRASDWSSTVGGGKGLTRAAARVGSIMEEVEKYCQDVYRPADELTGTYAGLRRRGDVIDPESLDLPYDSAYRERLPIAWAPCFDLLQSRWLLVPSARLVMARQAPDIYYSERLGSKVFTTNGLASGFTLEEAVLHGLCEFVERHSQRMAELQIANPGRLGGTSFSFVALDTAPRSVRALVNRFSRAGLQTRVLDITSEVGIPTFEAKIFEDFFTGGERSWGGFGAHPKPDVAIEMALFEAAQTKIGNVAGSREDLSVNVRSLGRHERAHPVLDDMLRLWYGSDPPEKPYDRLGGNNSRDVRDDIQWCVARVREAGFEHVLVADYSVPDLAPARVVRIIIPGMETNNPFHAGLRARVGAVRDLLPRG
jgi:ribosomal protein S12 methylthiotransferase accessory factor